MVKKDGKGYNNEVKREKQGTIRRKKKTGI